MGAVAWAIRQRPFAALPQSESSVTFRPATALGRRPFDALRVLRKFEFVDKPFAQVRLPAGRGHQKILRLGSGGAPTGRGEHVRPHVEHVWTFLSPKYQAMMNYQSNYGLEGRRVSHLARMSLKRY
jgi:hypothetical protein